MVGVPTLLVRIVCSLWSALALFTATGVGFIPFRAMDTYRKRESLILVQTPVEG